MRGMMTKVGVLLSVLIVSSLVGCVGAPLRAPSSTARTPEEQAAEQKKRASLRALIPSEFQIEIPIDADTMPSLVAACKASSAATWLRSVSQEELAARDAYVLEQLNRPFYIVAIDDDSGRTTFLGKKDDLRDLVCLGLTIRDGDLKSAARVGSAFISRGAALEKLNFQGVSFLLNAWRDGAQTADDAALLLRHPALSPSEIPFLMDDLSRSTFPPEKRLKVLTALFQTPLYRSEFTTLQPKLYDQIHLASSFAEKIALARLYLKQVPAAIPAEKLLPLVLDSAQASDDMTDFYIEFFRPHDLSSRVTALLTLFRSQAQFRNADAEIMSLWNSPLDPNSVQRIVAYAVLENRSAPRLSPEITYQILFSSLSRGATRTSQLRELLEAVRRPEVSDLPHRLGLFRRVCAVADMEPSLAGEAIYTATVFVNIDRVAPMGLNECVFSLQKRFSGHNEVMTHYLLYLRGLGDDHLLLELSETYLPFGDLTPGFLEDVAAAAIRTRDEPAELILKRVLAHKALTERSLEFIAGRMTVYTGQTTALEKTLLDQIDAHPLVSEKIKALNKRTREGTAWQPLDSKVGDLLRKR